MVLVGIGVSDEFRIQIARMVRRLQREAEIVHGEDVFEEFGFLEVADAAGLARRIELVRQRVGARVEIVIVFRFVDAHAPQNDGRMVPVAANHAADVVDGNIFPGFVSDVLPAGNLFENEQADFVAGVKKVARLRIVRGADDVALELVAQDLGVAALGAAGHGLADKGKRLVTIEAAQLDDFAVQFEAVIGELGFAKAEAAGVFVQHLRAAAQADAGGVEIAVFQLPELDSAKLVEMNGRARPGSLRPLAMLAPAARLSRRRDRHRAVRRRASVHLSRLPDAERNRSTSTSGVGESTFFRANENVLDKGRGHDSQRDFAVNAAEGEIVDFVSERRNVGALGGIDIDGENVFSVEVEVRRQLEGERRVSAFVFAERAGR